MGSKQNAALENFNNGYNCCQSVILALAPEDYSKDQIVRISTGFGGGMGQEQEVCGAVSGAIMALGLKYGGTAENVPVTYGKVRELMKQFKEERGSIYCRKLLGCNLKTEEGKEYRKKHNLRETVCCECVKTATGLAESL